MKYFEVKASFERTLENGMQSKVTEVYLFDAINYTEAEARTNKELTPFGEFEIIDIKQPRISEIFFNESGDRWYSGKVNLILLDENSYQEKKKPIKVLAQASTIREAMEVIEKGMEGTLADWELVEIKETLIMDVYPYVPKEGEEKPIQTELFPEMDPLFCEAVKLVQKHDNASPRFLMAKLQIGERRVEKLFSQLEEQKAVLTRVWTEEFHDEDTGEPVSIKRKEIEGINKDYKLPD
ncbi:DNA segregation ATPase FtsK/SpoIIIE-like protein [Parabacteroides sp. PF5-5]|uniref:DUF4494 family protein n=1 Tax=unclassified Parabacteroides TaxID=2649774 RepID=UPI00247D5F66|nr:DNA segregation ATPase FtsK/SpoIIIE-like protein [Parabacteroides sp. PH5-39]MDH6315752.1 DNA segregation ATPase FtsK/SpoIIIE-like protein [Parabacteroides sp. PF5-13]MDH6319412.1 DNA segregation ATPase FtsK/SpoIIIE-like protein [Parabacteroides sp. PH5-13]MDH6323143.1 DNA segregation ATPase FtsK/SpoIIIE-like protein [Parabacteroides sp. PH5-8]MDH6326945.1 DNA segregation ATPase FtsK/SpoIIIE-like protein [Parabacteroides sp. PH5-41]MDH6334626.1 DNA segregation ATPase FtsK/SpoIIIE-like prote